MFMAGFDIMRVHGGYRSDDMYQMTFGQLFDKLKKLLAEQESNGSPTPGFGEFLKEFRRAKDFRNDLAHGIPTTQGLFRREPNKPESVRMYDTIEKLNELSRTFRRIAALGDSVAKHDIEKFEDWVRRGYS